MAARNCEMAPSRSPTFSSLVPGIRIKSRRLQIGLILADLRSQARFPGCRPRCRPTAVSIAASVVWAPAKSGCRRIASLQRCRRLRQFALLFQHRAQSVMRLGIIGFGLDRSAQSFSGLIEIALLPQRDPSV